MIQIDEENMRRCGEEVAKVMRWAQVVTRGCGEAAAKAADDINRGLTEAFSPR